MAKVFAAFKALKKPNTKLILLPDPSLELLTLFIIIAGRICLRCFRAIDKILKLRKNMRIRGMYPIEQVIK